MRRTIFDRRYASLAGAALLFTAFLLLYLRTAAPSVLSGDSAEFQFSAPLLAVPHPTGYPLYTLLGFLASQVPGDSARRVTQVSSLCAALCVAILFLLAQTIGNRLVAALVAALALGFSPGLWNAATLAEVYALNALLIGALCLSLAWNRGYPGNNTPRKQFLVGLLCGLGISHHSSFLFSAAPLAAAYAVTMLTGTSWFGRHVYQQPGRDTPTIKSSEPPRLPDAQLPAHFGRSLLALGAGGLLGLTPWLLPLIQYARFGPFEGDNHGLPRFYFWGAPTRWSEALAHLAGGKLREDAAVAPGLANLPAIVRLVWERLQFEFGLFGLVLGLLGCLWLLRRQPLAGAGSLWIVGGSGLFLTLLGPSVQDAPVFTLPIMLPWALWIGCGALALFETAGRIRLYLPDWGKLLPGLILAGCLALTLAWGLGRRPYADKAALWLFRSYGEQVLAQLEPEAAIITRWEQGTILQYLILVEQQRPDVWVDIVEPGDEPWAQRSRRYHDRPVYFLGNPDDADPLLVREIWPHDYAGLYRLEHALPAR